MQQKLSHDWVLSIDQAYELQRKLAEKVTIADRLSSVGLVAGVDVAYDKNTDELVAGVAVLELATLSLVEFVWSRAKQKFPYVPGLFSFRELPAVVESLHKLTSSPDLFVCDGQGIAHPLRFGLASHLGVIYDVPSIGCAKTRLFGEYSEPDQHRGAFSYLVDNGEKLGAVLRTQTGVKPVFVSPGHKVSIKTAVEFVLALTPNYRLPETTRKADQLVRSKLKEP